ncbi:MAG: hypothetical protein AAGE18_10700 [Pseudomonadota bacterium]
MQGVAFRLDDAWIVLLNAKALWEGDQSFAGLPPLHGSTSLLHTLAVAALRPVLGGPLALWLLSWLALFVAGLGAMRLVRDLGGGELAAAGLALAAVTTGGIFDVLLNGLETGWAIAAVLWALLLARRDPLGLGTAVLLGALPFVRPELGLLSLVLGLYGLRSAWIAGEWWRGLPAGARALTTALALLALQVLLSGEPLPSTGGAKAAFFSQPGLSPTAWIPVFFYDVGYFLGAVGVVGVAALLPIDPVTRIGVAFSVLLLIAFGVLYPTIAGQNFGRYFYPILGAGIFALGLLLGHPSRRGRTIGATLLLVVLATNLWTMVRDAPESVALAAGKRDGMAAVSAWLETHLPPGQPLMLHDIGYVAWATERPLIDVVGLKTPAAREAHRRHAGLGTAGQLSAVLDSLAWAEGGCFVMISNGFDRRGLMRGALPSKGWSLTLVEADGGPPGYRVWALTDPDGRRCD